MEELQKLPDCVYIRFEDGTVQRVAYRKLKQHEEWIIEDNIQYGLRHPEYSDESVDDYEKEARKEWKDLKNALRKRPDSILVLDERTERYVLSGDYYISLQTKNNG